MYLSRYEVYRLKEARKRNLQPLTYLQSNQGSHGDEDDTDSGISLHGNGCDVTSHHGDDVTHSHGNISDYTHSCHENHILRIGNHGILNCDARNDGNLIGNHGNNLKTTHGHHSSSNTINGSHENVVKGKRKVIGSYDNVKNGYYNNTNIRNHGHPGSNGNNSAYNGFCQMFSTDLPKKDLITVLSGASIKNPAYIKAKILQGFTTSRPGTELTVETGENVYLLYREQDKVLAVNSEGKRGFIPLRNCSSYETIPTKLRKQPDNSVNESLISDKKTSKERVKSDISHRGSHTSSVHDEKYSDSHRGASAFSNLTSSLDRKSSANFRQSTKAFRKSEGGTKMIVLYDFLARDENDISVYKGEKVLVLNQEDVDWWWVLTAEGCEGFVPRAYLSFQSNESSEGMTNLLETSVSSSTKSPSSSTSEANNTQVRFQVPLCTFHRYDVEEEWESASEVDSGVPLDKIVKADQDTDKTRCSTWC